MPEQTPHTVNAFVERQLTERVEGIERYLNADALALTSPISPGLDVFIRDLVEALKDRRTGRNRLIVILTTEGGTIEVVQRIVETIRAHYEIVEFIIPNAAQSAGTVLALSGDAIRMDYFSRLGPIDPQIFKNGQMVPAMGYLIQYQRLLQKANDGTISTAEAQMLLTAFDQAELYQYEQARNLSIALIEEWLAQYKFKNWTETETRRARVDDRLRHSRAEAVATALSDTELWLSHGRGISMDRLRAEDIRLKIDDYGKDRELSDKIGGYYNLLRDYMGQRRETGSLHISGRYLGYVI